MPVTEFATLKLKESYTIDSEVLREPFRSVAERQAAWSGYPLTFYTNIQDTSLLYIVAGWKDSTAHKEWIASEENQRYLAILGPKISIGSLAHVDIDFSQIPSDTQILAIRKEILEDKGSEQAEESANNTGAAWVGQGINTEDPKDLYYFKAYDSLDDISNPRPEENILRRIHF